MNPEVKTKWLEALRSGEYEQARGALVRQRSDDGKLTYCCLGVLCELALDAGIVERSDADEWTMGYKEPDGWVETGILPHAVAKWADINQHGELSNWGIHLPSMNDAGTPFSVIADVIEKNF